MEKKTPILTSRNFLSSALKLRRSISGTATESKSGENKREKKAGFLVCSSDPTAASKQFFCREIKQSTSVAPSRKV
jgi:hypothetical protein